MNAALVRSGPKTRAAPPRESQTPPGEPASTGAPSSVFLHKSERSLVAGVYGLGDGSGDHVVCFGCLNRMCGETSDSSK